MRAETAEFIRDLEDLSKLLRRIEIEEELHGCDLSGAPAALQRLVNRYKSSVEPFALRRANYSMFVVMLYSSFEQFVERLIAKLVTSINEIVPAFGMLPSAIQRSHRKKSLEALCDDAWLDRQGDPELARKLVEGLHLCEAGLSAYRLNAIAYSRHTSNYRVSSIAQGFNEIGMENFNTSVARSDPFLEYIGSDVRQRGLFDASLGALDDLAIRRNDVAHGNAVDLLSPDQLSDYLDFLRCLGLSFFAVARDEVARYLVSFASRRIGRADIVHYKRVVEMDLGALPEGYLVRKGDPVVMQPISGESRYTAGRVVNIRTDGGDTESILAEPGQVVALELDYQIRRGRTLFLVRRDAPCAWVCDNSPL